MNEQINQAIQFVTENFADLDYNPSLSQLYNFVYMTFNLNYYQVERVKAVTSILIH